MALKLKFIISILILLFGYYFIFFGYKIIFFKKKPLPVIFDSSKLTKDSNIFKDINLKNNEINNSKKIKDKQELKEIVIQVKKNQTFLSIIQKYLTSNVLIFDIINEIEKKFDLRKLKADQKIFLYQNKFNKKLEKIKIPIQNNINLNVLISKEVTVEKKYLNTKYENHSKEYLISNSLYSDGIKNNIPIEILEKLIKLYSFDLDFQRDIRKDTRISISYEAIIIEDRDSNYFGDINYALIEIEKNILEYFKFKTDDGFIDYFDRKGQNVKKSLLKTPLDGAKLSSGFGMRKHPILGFNKMHKGVDFAAPKGTPVFAGGNGKIEFIGRNGGYGNYIRIRHNNEYKTAYAHLSGFKKGISKGLKVNQGEVIGYVGSTGKSTGPHLHYEILYKNKQINPIKLKLPSGKKLKNNELERFIVEMKVIYANHLNLLYE